MGLQRFLVVDGLGLGGAGQFTPQQSQGCLQLSLQLFLGFCFAPAAAVAGEKFLVFDFAD